jgi:hypothetical protein
MTDPVLQELERLREYRRRADAKRRERQVQARLPPKLAQQFTAYMQAHGLNQSQAIVAILSTFFN